MSVSSSNETPLDAPSASRFPVAVTFTQNYVVCLRIVVIPGHSTEICKALLWIFLFVTLGCMIKILCIGSLFELLELFGFDSYCRS